MSAVGNTLYVGGDFSAIGGAARRNLAAVDAVSGMAVHWNPDPDADGDVWSLATEGASIYAGGGFRRMGGFPCAGLAAIAAWSPGVDKRAAVTLTPALPLEFALQQTAPNPARTDATIHFALPSAAPVTLTLYDIQGRRMATLLDRQILPPGPHDVSVRTGAWPAGCYVYRLETGGRSAARRMFVVH
ncbi:MAG TPA: T9SS type A sorting domain-containing protein [Candidatus Eisenbacteria bacterium]|nr:T9SS type A sorting domain-containing protein [Candidatus Eisenbacteria bacterium]